MCRLKRPQDIVNVVLVGTTDGVKEREIAEHYREFMEAYKVT